MLPLVRPALKREGEEHLWYRLLHPDEYREERKFSTNNLLTTIAYG